MDKIKILAIAPYEGMKGIMSDIASKKERIELTTFVGDLEDGLRIVYKHKRNNFDIIISRGGTAELISKSTDIPVIEVSISVYDVLRAIKLAENYAQRFAIVGFPSITKCAHLLCDLLQYKIKIITISSKEEARECLVALLNDGYGLVLSDMVTTTVAKHLGMNSILINSGYESIESTLEQAMKLCQFYSRKNFQNKILKVALQESSHDLFIFEDNNLLYSSLLELEENQYLFTFARQLLSKITEGKDFIQDKKWNKQLLSFKGKCIQIDGRFLSFVYLTIHALSAEAEGKGIRLVNDDMNYLLSGYNSIHSLNYIRSNIEQYAVCHFPVLVIGEVGTGKDRAVSLLYEASSMKNNPFYQIDCGILTATEWNYLFTDSDSPLRKSNCFFYFKNIGALTEQIMTDFIIFLESVDLSNQNFVAFSFILNNKTDETHPNCLFFSNKLSCLILRLKPLKEMRPDIPGLASIYINELNTILGKHITRFEPKALTLLQEFNWTYNLDQFKRVLKELAVITSDSTITFNNTSKILNQEVSNISVKEKRRYAVNLNQNLREINYDIACLVLEEEGMNQSSAAKRLGISRSTLWRLLKLQDNKEK